MKPQRHVVPLLLFALAGCTRGPAVLTESTLPLRRVVVYRNGVGYFERRGHVARDEVQFRVLQSDVGDFLATLAVMEQGGSSVRSAAFPMPRESSSGEGAPSPTERRAVRLALDGRDHDLVVGYMVETPIWRPTYRLVFQEQGVQVQAWGIVQNTSGEDWSGVNLSLVAGMPVSFRTELAQPVIPPRPVVRDSGAVITSVPQSETTLSQEESNAPAPPPPPPSAVPEPSTEDASGGSAGEGAPVPSERRRSLRAQGSASRSQPTTSAPYNGPSAPRNLASLAALAVQGGATRYDLPNPVTIPDHSATMVMLSVRDVPGERMYLFAPDPGVPESASHPFHVARFENRTGAMLERGGLAIFEAGAFLGQGMLEALPDGATTTVPFALERGLAVESSATGAIEGGRLVRIARDTITLERYRVTRTTYRARNGLERAARIMLRLALDPGAVLHDPPTGTEQGTGSALVPLQVPARNRAETVVQTRVPFTIPTDWTNDEAARAIEAYLREARPPPPLATALQTALDLRRAMVDLTRQRATLDERRSDLQQNAEETRQNLRAIQRNAAAADLRAQLTARLARIATELDQITRRIVELDTQIGEKRVRLAETVRTIELDLSTTPATPAAAP